MTAGGSPVRGGAAHRRGVLTVVVIATALASLDLTIVATALPTIAGQLHGMDRMGELTTAYVLAATMAMPVFGKLGDRVGRRVAFQVAVVTFLAGSVAAGMSGSMAVAVASRAVQGLGGGGLTVGAQAIVGSVFSPRERGRYQAMLGGVYALSSVTGPLVGGLLVDHLSWRWIFYLNLPLGLIALVTGSRTIRLPRTSATANQPGPGGAARADIAGAIFLATATGALVLGLSLAGPRHPWGSPAVAGLLGFAALAAGAWLASALRAADPVLPLRLFRDRVFAVSSTVAALTGAALFSAISFLPTLAQFARPGRATAAGVAMLPLMGGVVVANLASGLLITRTGRYRLYPAAGCAVAAVGLALLSTLDGSMMDRPVGMVLLACYSAILGLGCGLVLQVLVLVVQNSAPPADLGTSTAAVTFLRQVGSSLGIAMVGSAFAHRFAAHLSALADSGPGDEPAQFTAHVDTLTPQALQALSPAARNAAADAALHALLPLFGVLAPLLLFAAAVALLLPARPLGAQPRGAPDQAGTAGTPGRGRRVGVQPRALRPACPRSPQPGHTAPTALENPAPPSSGA